MTRYRRRWPPIVIILFMVGSALAAAGPANADDEDFDWGAGGVTGGGNWHSPGGTDVWTDSPTLGDNGYIYTYEHWCFDGDAGDVLCLDENTCDQGPDGQYVLWKRSVRIEPPDWVDFEGNGPTCVYSENPEDLLEEVTTLLLTEFQEHPVYAGRIASQPGPHTMKGAETNFYVDSEVQVINTVLLGQDVQIVATPTEYLFHYGDGTESDLTYDAGALLPDPQLGKQTATSHVYATTGDFRIYATVYFTAEYSLNGGPMIPIDGRGVFDTPTEMVSVWKSESRNVADDCLINPTGFGC